MPKYFFFIFFTFINVLAAFSQQTVFSYPLSISKTDQKNYAITSLVSVDEKNKSLCLILKDNNKIEYFLLSPDFKIISQISPNNLRNSVYGYESQRLLNLLKTDQGFNFMYGVKDKSLFNNETHIRAETVNFEKKEVSIKNFFLIADGEVAIEQFVSQGKYYYITANEKTDELIFYISDNGKVEKKAIKFNLKDFHSVKKQTLPYYFMYAQTFSTSEETSLKAGSELSKFFIKDNKVLAVVANDKEPPHLIDIDLNTFALSKRKLSMAGFCGFTNKKEIFYNNSYVFESRLYVLNVCKEMIEIGVFDPISGTLIKKHEIPESDDSFFNDNATSSRTIGKNEREKELKTKELIKKMTKGSLGIAAAKNVNGNIILTCGTYDETIVGGGGYYVGGFTSSSMATGSTHASSNIPVTRSAQTYNSQKNYKDSKGSKATIVTSFKVVLDAQKADILINEPVESRHEIITGYMNDFQVASQARNIFSFNGKLYFGFYDSNKKQFLIQYLAEDKQY